MTPEVKPASPAQADFLRELIESGLLIESGVPGVFGHGAALEEIRRALEARLEREAAARGAEPLRFPPALARRTLESSGYLDSFPHLAGAVFAFEGGEREAELQAQRAAGHEDWSEFQRMTDLTLMPAACYPVYPVIAARGPLRAGGVFVDVGGAWVFRREPSHDPSRRQMFHQHELVRIGEPETVQAWRDDWAQLGLRLLRAFGLDAELDRANDPFFGRRGRMLAASQREQALKFELVAPLGGEQPTALASFNQHLDHFGTAFGIKLADGATAETACLGFGHERIALALLWKHGLDAARWPAAVRAELFGA